MKVSSCTMLPSLTISNSWMGRDEVGSDRLNTNRSFQESFNKAAWSLTVNAGKYEFDFAHWIMFNR